MTLQQMEYILALDKYRHFVLAAESCGVTQPTLSAMIQKLEEELDVKIFNRDKKGITPTSVGEKIIRQARIALNESNRIKEVVADEVGTMSGSLHIGIIPTIAPYIVPDFIYHFRNDYPEMKLVVDERANNTLLNELKFGNIDMAITTSPGSGSEFLEIPIYIEHFVAYFSEKCNSGRNLFDDGNIPTEHMWILKEGHCIQSDSFSFCKNKEEGNHIYEAGSIDTLVRIVDRNGGYTIIPELHLAFLTEQQKKNTKVLSNLKQPAQRCVSILIKEDFVRERVLNAVREVISKIIPSYMMEERFRKYNIKLR